MQEYQDQVQRVRNNRYFIDDQACYSSFLEEMPVSIVVVNNNKCIYINNSALRLLDLKEKEEIIGKDILRIIHHDHHHHLVRVLDQCTEKLQILHNIKLISNEKSLTQIQIKAKKIIINNEYFIQLVFTEMKEFSQSYQMQELETLSVVGELAAGIAHEIRNPLTSLKGFIQLVQEYPEKGQLYSDIMVKEIERINLIVNELLLLAKPMVTNYQERNLLEILDATIMLLNTQAILKAVKINFNLSQNMTDLKILCDENKLKQVFINIIKNGIEAMPHGGELIIDMNVNRLIKEVSVTFEDNGKGIPKQYLPRIGEAFFTTKPEGTGLGLMMSMNIIKNHNGHINIKSEEGVGTRIEVILPIQ